MGSYQDMRLRVINASPCPVKAFLHRLGSPGCWPYGILFFSFDEDGEGAHATFGDLRVPVTAVQAIELILLAKGEAQGAVIWDQSGMFQRQTRGLE